MKMNKYPSTVVLFLLILLASPVYSQTSLKSFDQSAALQQYNVVWNTLGNNSADSMPLGNGDIAMNVWTDQNGDLLFYISKSDALNELANPVKVGKLRVSVSPNPFVPNKFVSQALILQHGEVVLTGNIDGQSASLHIWVDANHPVIRCEVACKKAINVTVKLESWRVTNQVVPGGTISADKILNDLPNSLSWYHRDSKPISIQLTNLTFGAAVSGKNFEKQDSVTLVTKSAANNQRFSVTAYAASSPAISQWEKQIVNLQSGNQLLNWDDAYIQHKKWWSDFWNRSYIFIKGDTNSVKVTQGYILQRFVSACAGRGAHAIKFNGSLFTVDIQKEHLGKDKQTGKDITADVNADFRAWGGQYWFQNTRPIYWPMLAQGDFDMMKPLFRQYFEMLPANSSQVRDFYHHDGAYFAETANYWGGIPNINPDSKGSYTFRYFTPILELSTMMLDYYDFTSNKKFATDTLLPIAMAGLTFYEQHFQTDVQGKLKLYPDNSIEMYWDVLNPLPDIAGLHYVTSRLLELPDNVLGNKNKQQIIDLKNKLPEIPLGVKNDKKVLIPYVDIMGGKDHNTENPELYAVYPFRIYGLMKPDLDIALETYHDRVNKRAGCWYQDVVDAPLLGLVDDAKKDVIVHLTNYDKHLRFPAFWERGHDYMPDEDNGGNGQLGLQKMLMQCDGKSILLLPAWPHAWSANFKLHAPDQTIVEGQVVDGKITNLVVSPESRRTNIIIYGQQK